MKEINNKKLLKKTKFKIDDIVIKIKIVLLEFLNKASFFYHEACMRDFYSFL